MLRDFKTFISRGNIIELAAAVVIGAAFGKIVDSLVKDIIMPPVGLVLNKVDFSNLFINLGSADYQTLAEAQKAGMPTINYGLFLNQVVSFLIVAFVIFLIVRHLNRFQRAEDHSRVTDKRCAFCTMSIPMAATRCPHCTSNLG